MNTKMTKERMAHRLVGYSLSDIFSGFELPTIEAILLYGARKDELRKMLENVGRRESIAKNVAESR